ncbi:hypothetical protein [Aeromonas veronii]|uniref:hypothetical protein n=1 Tax=Aeromonas veronii TaxID=654 RepID=UPI0038B50319
MDVHFSILYKFTEELVELVEICNMECQKFIIIAANKAIYDDLISSIKDELDNVIFSYVSSPTELGSIKNLMNIRFGLHDDYFYYDLEKINDGYNKVKQFDVNFLEKLYVLDDKRIDLFLNDLDPSISFFVKRLRNETNNFDADVGRLLIGESFLSDSNIITKINCSDFDAIRLSELSEFLKYLKVNKNNYKILQCKIDDAINIIQNYIVCTPQNSSQFTSHASNNFIQDSFPCVYKINAAINYLAYEFSAKKKLYNKAFMHLFRTYEYYSSGALFSTGEASFGNAKRKGVIQQDCFLINNKPCSGFYPVYKGLLSPLPNLSSSADYIKMDDYISMRNRFHYTHGDLKISEKIVNDFSVVVLNQILFLEGELNQRRMLFNDIFVTIKDALILTRIEKMTSIMKGHFWSGVEIP